MSAKSTSKFDRAAVLRWIPLDQIHVSPLAQRDLRQAWVDRILADLDLEQIGVPIVNLRDGDTDVYYVIDGQHRVAALRAFFEADLSIKIQCWVYFGLTQDVEAEKFLKLSNTLTIDAFSKFRIGVTAWRTVEVDIDRIVRANGSVVSRDEIPGAIGAVAALRKIYDTAGGECLGRTIRVIRDAYGDPGFDTYAMQGVALVLDRYGDEVDDLTLVTRLDKARGGVKGLLQRAEHYRLTTGNYKTHCVAAAVVDTYNSGRGGKHLTSWWKDAA